MSLYKRKKSDFWWISVTINGKRIRESTGTDNKLQAREFHDSFISQIWKQDRLGVKARVTWQEAVVRYMQESELKPSLANDKAALTWVHPFLCDKYLDEISKDLIEAIVKEKQKPYVRTYKSGQVRICKPGVDTVNRFLNTIRALLIRARDEWEWVERVPKVRALKGAMHRTRWITRGEAELLIDALPNHLAAMARFSLETGLRRANVTHLTWGKVDLERATAWVEAGEVKNRKALSVPLTDKAMSVLLAQKESKLKHAVWVFPRGGKPVMQTSTRAFRDAVARAGITDFCWHDLRHTWASWHVQGGTPLHVLQELGGWSSVTMVQRYAHLGSEHLREYVNRPALKLVVDNARTGTQG